MPDLKGICARFEALSQQRPSESGRRELAEGLASRHDGAVVCAARALCRWGDETSVAMVKVRLEDFLDKRNRYSTLQGLLNALGPCVKGNDIDWAVGLYGRCPDAGRYTFWPFFNDLPASELKEALDRCERGKTVMPGTIGDLRERMMWRVISDSKRP